MKKENADVTMNDKSSTDAKAALDQNAGEEVGSNGRDRAPSDFVIGMVTFIIFLIFMTVWMYFLT